MRIERALDKLRLWRSFIKAFQLRSFIPDLRHLAHDFSAPSSIIPRFVPHIRQFDFTRKWSLGRLTKLHSLIGCFFRLGITTGVSSAARSDEPWNPIHSLRASKLDSKRPA